MTKNKENLEAKIKSLASTIANLENERLEAQLAIVELERQEKLDRSTKLKEFLTKDLLYLLYLLAPKHSFDKRKDTACDDDCSINSSNCTRCALLDLKYHGYSDTVYNFDFTCKTEN